MVNPELLEILVCPETKQTLVVADAETLGRVNQPFKQAGSRTRAEIA